MRIDNDGEGGIIALMTLLGVKRHQRPLIVAAGLFGAALIYGDGAITPAISVLSALEGVEQIAPSLQTYVLPAASVILLALFAIQPFGTAAIGRAFGPIMLALVHRHSGARRARNHPASLRRRSDQSALRRRLPHERRLQGVSRAGRRVSVRDRGGGALRRHGPFRAEADPLLVEPDRLSGPHSQLRRTGRHRARRRADRRQHLLPALPSAASHADDRARDNRHRDRQPVDHHRRLFDDPPGDAARLAAAHEHHSDFGGRLRPDLRRRGQLAAHDRDPRPDDRLRQVGQPRGRLRHRGVGDDADDERAVVHRHARDLELAGMGRRRGRGTVCHHRRRVSRRQPGQGDAGRLGSAAAGFAGLWRDVDLAPRARSRSSAASKRS